MSNEIYRTIIQRIENLRREIAALEDLLHSQNIETRNIVNEQELERVSHILGERLQGTIPLQLALARINFRDDYYGFIRAIDGDTIVVEPPTQLREWMKDIHVRLYGLETPELSEDLGPQYQKHLEDLCSIDARGRLMIVWERERAGTGYDGFPLTSFERGIGHVFFKSSDNRYLYINGLMHLLRYSTLFRAEKNLLRGRRHIETLNLRIPWDNKCATDLRHNTNVLSPTLELIASMRPPICLISYPSLPSFDSRSEQFSSSILKTLQSDRESSLSCPFKSDLIKNTETLLPRVLDLSASSFDIPLTYLSQWSAKHNI